MKGGVSSATDVIGADVRMGVVAVFVVTVTVPRNASVGVRRRGKGCLQWKNGDKRSEQATLFQRHWGLPASAHVDAAALGHAPAIGMVETFHDLLTLDTSVLNRGRDARQFTVSAQAALVMSRNIRHSP